MLETENVSGSSTFRARSRAPMRRGKPARKKRISANEQQS
jgi:hypothetical protein